MDPCFAFAALLFSPLSSLCPSWGRCQQTQRYGGLNQTCSGPFQARDNQWLDTPGGGGAFGPLGAQCPLGHCCVEQRGQERRAPPGGKAGKDTRGHDSGGANLELGCFWRVGPAPREVGPVPACRALHAIRSAAGARRKPFLRRSHFTFILIPPIIIIIFFPRKAGTRDCPSERRRGRHFPGKAQRASAPGAPEREPEGSARPRALLRAGRGLTAARDAPLTAEQPSALAPAARVPGLTFSGAARPRTPVPSLRPAPPRPFHCQPGAAGARPGHPRSPPRAALPGVPWPLHRPLPPISPPRRPGASLLPLLRPELRIPRSSPILRVQPRPGPRGWTPHPSSSSLLAQDAPGSSPAAGILPLL